MRRIDITNDGFRAEHDLHRDLFTHRAANEIFEPRDGLVEINRLRAQPVAAREDQKLTHDIGAVIGGAAPRVDMTQPFFVARNIAHTALEQFQIAQHDRQQIVEIMRDAPGQPADGLEFLRMPEGFFCARRILLRDFEIARLSVGILLFFV